MHSRSWLLRRFALPVVALLAFTAVACGTSDHAATPKTLTVGYVVDPSWAQVPVAQAKGLFAQEGLNVKVVNFSTGVEALDALKAGVVDVTTAADVPAAAAIAKDPAIRVVGDGSVWTGSRIVARKDRGVTSFAQLAGKKIATPIGTSAHYFVASALERAGIRATLVSVKPPGIVPAASQGDVDAVSIFQPFQAQVADVFKQASIEIDVPGGAYQQHSLYLSRTTTISGKKAELAGFFSGLRKAGEALQSGDSSAVHAVASATTLTPELLQRILPEFRYQVTLEQQLADQLAQVAQWSQANKFIPENQQLPDYHAALDSSVVGNG